MRKNRIYRYALLLPLLVACQGQQTSTIPNYPVNLELYITRDYPHFVPANLMQSMVFEQPKLMTERVGYGGVLVCVGMDGNYYAYDMACPFECLSTVRVYPDGMFAVCEQCGEKYEIAYGVGNPTKSSTASPLRRYGTQFSNGVLRIRN